MSSAVRKPRGQRVRPPKSGSKRSRVESDSGETPLSPAVTRSGGSFSYRDGQQNQGGSPRQISPTCAEATGRSIQDERMVVDSDCGPLSQQSKFRHVHDLRPNCGGSTLQKCPISDGHGGQAKEPGDNDLVVNSFGREVGSSPSFQQARSRRRLQTVSNHGSRKLGGRDDLFRQMRDIVRDRRVDHCDKVVKLHERVSQHLDEIEVETDKWKNLFRSRSEAMSVLEAEKKVLQEMVEKLSNEPIRCKVLYSRKVELDAAGNPVQKVAQEHGSSNIVTQTQCECTNVIEFLHCEFLPLIHRQFLSLKETMQVSLSEPQKCSHKRNCRFKPKSGKDNNFQQLDPICGSYTDEAATPKLLDSALSTANTAVKVFQKEFVERAKSREDKPWDQVNPDLFARPMHVAYYVKSAVNEIFFEGFENESFNTMSGKSKFLDPDVRQANFYRYYLHEQEQNSPGDIGDPQFKEFCEVKASLFCERFHCMKINWLEELELTSSFSAAARSVWLLHKLAFSFEPPAFIFRVEPGADVDPNYMKTVVALEDNEKFTPKVGFMITPGLRLRKTVMPCEVYLACT